MNTAINFNNVSKQYGHFTALDQVSLEIKAGSYVGLVGANGAGKTTLIKCLLDFCALQTGKIEIFGEDHKTTSARNRLVFLPERFTPPHFVTGHDFLQHMARLHRQTIDDGRLSAITAALDLDRSALSKPVRALSKGMAQKLGLAAVLISDKDLLLLDEPMSGLDPKARALLKRYLFELRQHGKTLFFSTHLLIDVETLCDEIIILHEGRVRFTGSPSACCEQYQTTSLEQAYISCIS